MRSREKTPRDRRNAKKKINYMEMECIIRMLIQYFFRSRRVRAYHSEPFFSSFSLDFTHLLQWLSPFSQKNNTVSVFVAVKCVKCKIRYTLEYNSLTASHECTHVCITFWKINFYDDCGKSDLASEPKEKLKNEGKKNSNAAAAAAAASTYYYGA